ncbi:MAG TPA: NUDIX hydrolase [Pseudonocardiaceae bacterium]|jgi:8-oxo-dGTP diphosphatase|nr:NUDIX hydrolase [Pseudonocardiaceae bacterium]
MWAAGTVLWRPGLDESGPVRIALVHRPRYDDWSLPKGKLEAKETLAACAVRETEEETGYRPILGRVVDDVRYSVGQPPEQKTIRYFTGRAPAGEFVPNDEVDELRWLTPAEAMDQLSYADDRRTVAGFTVLPADTRTVLLVRHAKAGSRANWPEADDLRPLSKAGRAQAEALRALLPLFGPTRVHSAPLVRCEQTVAGLAEDLGVPVVPEHLLTEHSHAAQPGAGRRRLLELVAEDPGVATDGGTGALVVSSQGGIIPALVGRLATESGLELDRAGGADALPCKKGSVWLLTFPRQPPFQLLAADYLPTALPAPEVG